MDSPDPNLKNIAALLRAHRPEPTEAELDEIKRRVLDRQSRRGRSRAWASWRARLVLASVFVLAFSVNAFGVPKAATTVISTVTNGTKTGNSSMVEYCPKDNPNNQQCQPRMTGGGTGTATIPPNTDVHHGFELRCDVNNPPNRLEVNWGPGESFHLLSLTSVMCLDDPNTAAPPPGANWDTYYGTGTGRLKGGETGTAEWCFQDGGEPGGGGVDKFTLKITDSKGNVVLFFTFSSNQGNEQAHGFTTSPSPGTCPAITATSTTTSSTTKKKK
ncbi:MAG TPA: hypothetical protein VJT68_01665 [Thermoleophilaceae bacterium]|nr:hypothetical protein [Thermoleophilaceae bacterium]